MDALSGACVDVGNSAKNCALSCINPLNWGGAKKGLSFGKSKNKAFHRPYIRKSTRREVESRAPRLADGRPIDPNTGLPIEGKPDLGHKTGHEHWSEVENAKREGLTQKEFNDRMNDPDLYQFEDPINNRSHRYERKL